MLQLSPPSRRLLDPRTQWQIKDLQNFFSTSIENQHYNKIPRWCTCIQVVPVSKEKSNIKIPWINLHTFCVIAPLKTLTLLYYHFHNQPLPCYGRCLALFVPRDTSFNKMFGWMFPLGLLEFGTVLEKKKTTVNRYVQDFLPDILNGDAALDQFGFILLNWGERNP